MRILLAVAQRDVRLALQLCLDEEPGTLIVGTASEAASLLALLQTAQPDVVVLDWDLPGHPPARLLAEAKRRDMAPHVVVIAAHAHAREEALSAGADAFVQTGGLPDRLLATVRDARSRQRRANCEDTMNTKGE
jgi:DNA-binding NarL/FixJ family response regulator